MTEVYLCIDEAVSRISIAFILAWNLPNPDLRQKMAELLTKGVKLQVIARSSSHQAQLFSLLFFVGWFSLVRHIILNGSGMG